MEMGETSETVGLLCPQYFRLLTEGMWHQYERQEGTDLTIRFSGCEIRVHRFLFSIFAPHMLDQSMNSLLDLSDVELDQEVVESILEFLYKGQVIVFKDKLEVLKLGAGKLGLGLVVDAIDQFFQAKVDDGDKVDNVFTKEVLKLPGEEVENGEAASINGCLALAASNTELVDVSELEWCEVTIEGHSVDIEIQDDSEKIVEEVIVEKEEEQQQQHEEEEEETEAVIEQKQDNVICESQLVSVDLWDLCLENNLKEIPPPPPATSTGIEDSKDTNETDAVVTQLVVIQPKKVCYKCSYCSYKTVDRTSFKKHLASKHRSSYTVKSKKTYKCEECDFVGGQRIQLSRHVQNKHSTDRPFACEQCNYRARTVIDLKYHTKRHLGVKFTCETCGKKCSSYSGLCQHRKLHTAREKRNVCHLCGYASSRKGDLNKHLENVHEYVAPKLSSLTTVSTNSSKRSSSALKTTEYRCGHCDYKTTIRVRWKNHLVAQHQLDAQGNPVEPQVECDQCDFKCLLQYQLAGHKAKMHPTKLYECEECDHVTHLKANLDVHVKSKHREERPYVCQTCGFSTKTSSQLKSHLRSHSDEKFFCEVCNNGYSSKQHLKRHLIVMHDPNARRHGCYLCSFVTKTKDALSQHVKRMHKTEML